METCHLSRLRITIQRGPFEEPACGAVSQQKKGQGVQFGAPTDPGAQFRTFPGGASCCTRGRRGCNLLQEPSVENYKVWIEWRGHQIDMLDWWGELAAIPHVDNQHRLAQKIQASLKIPQVRCKVLKVSNDYFLPPALKCIGMKAFLLILDPRIPCQDYREGQPQKTLAYAQALQYWAKKANPPKPDQPHLLARCVHELRWAMRPFTTFTDEAVLKGTTPKQGTPEEWATGQGMMETTQTPMPERRPATSPEKPTAPLAEEPDVPATVSEEPADVPVAPPTPPETDKKMEVAPAHEFPGWMEIHPSCLLTPVG